MAHIRTLREEELDTLNICGHEFVRIGTPTDGSCFFHAILRALHNGYQNTTAYKERRTIVDGVRKKLASDLTLDEYKKLGNGALLDNSVMILARELLDKYALNTLKIPESKWDVIVGEAMKDGPSSSHTVFERFSENVSRLLANYTNPAIVKSIFNNAVHRSYVKYKHELSNSSRWSDAEIVMHVLEYMRTKSQIDICILSREAKRLCNVGTRDTNECRAVILLYYFDDLHYELIGRHSDNGDIKTLFSPTHPIIRYLKK